MFQVSFGQFCDTNLRDMYVWEYKWAEIPVLKRNLPDRDAVRLYRLIPLDWVC